MVVERELAKQGIRRRDLGREKFIERVWAWRRESGDAILAQLRRLGCSLDWSRLRFTMDPDLSRAVRHAFVQLYRDGLIYKGRYVVNWCPRCETAVSDLEVVHRETKGTLYHDPLRRARVSRGAPWSRRPGPRRCSATPRWRSIPTTRAPRRCEARRRSCRS